MGGVRGREGEERRGGGVGGVEECGDKLSECKEVDQLSWEWTGGE